MNQLRQLLNHPFIRGSSRNFLGSLGVNFLSYIFNIIIGRMLGPELYSEYFSLITIWYLASLPSSVLQTALIKQIAHYAAVNNTQEMRQALHVGLNISAMWGISIGFGLLISSPLILSFLKIDDLIAYILMVLIIIMAYISIPFLSLYYAKEKYLVASSLSGSGIFIRTAIVAPLLFIQPTISTVLVAMIIGGGIQLSLSILLAHYEIASGEKIFQRMLNYLQRLTRRAIVANEVRKDISRTLRTSFIATFGLASLTQLDILLARSRLSPEDAGLYVSLAVTGKIIPFFTLPLTGVLLPQVTAKIARKEEYRSTISLAATLVGVGSGVIALFYTLFPTFVINIFLGNQYLASAQYLGVFGLFQTLYALTSLGVMACIAMNNFKAASVVTISASLQLVGILLLPPTIFNIIAVSIFSVSVAAIYYAVILFYRPPAKS